jgi:hypothetical protein
MVQESLWSGLHIVYPLPLGRMDCVKAAGGHLEVLFCAAISPE